MRALVAILIGAACAARADAQTLRVTFEPEPTTSLAKDARPAPPSAGARAAWRPRSAGVGRTPVRSIDRAAAADTTTPVPTALDVYLQDGFETALAVSAFDPTNAVTAFQEGWDFNPDIPLSVAGGGKQGWVSIVFPPGTGIYDGFPFSPWAVAGNEPGTFFTSLIRYDLYPTDNTHTIVARSADAGANFDKFYEVDRSVLQDRAMFDIDRNAMRGGEQGPHDGKLYLGFDDWGAGGSAYEGSYLQVLSPAGDLLSELPLSGTGAVPFRGTQFQPVAGTLDGQVFLVSNSISGGGATVQATFHEIRDAGGGTLSFSKGTLSWSPAGQRLGGSTLWGVNGFRIDERGFLDVDRSSGPRHGYLYFITDRNPNPSDPTKDQGDLYLSVSFTRGSSWQTAKLPFPPGLTQFFPMLDVDEQGWIHVAYYQNEWGLTDKGVLHTSKVNVYYSVSRDGGQSWTSPVQVNQNENSLNLEDPPIELSPYGYDLLGDYMQIQAVGSGEETSAYVAWTGYDQYRSDDGVGTKKQRVYATQVTTPQAPGLSPQTVAALGGLLALAGALAAVRRRGVRVGRS